MDISAAATTATQRDRRPSTTSGPMIPRVLTQYNGAGPEECTHDFCDALPDTIVVFLSFVHGHRHLVAHPFV